MVTTKKAARSGNPAMRASAAQDFKQKAGGVLELPSGLAIKVRSKGGLRGFVTSGMIPNSLMSIVQESLDKGQEPDVSAMIAPDSLDTEMISDMLTMVDTVVCQVAVEPKVYPVPEDEDDRDDDLVYIDEIEDEDKMFIFQWVTGGTRDLARFREEFASTVVDLDRRANPQSQTK